MAGTPDIAALAALIGDPARARMLEALMSGRALAAGELANEAGVTAQTASAHLTKMIDAGLLLVEAQGRHRYYRLAGPAVAAALESMMGLAARTGRLRTRPGPRDAAMRRARDCYDHLAGDAGVRPHDAMVARGDIVPTAEGLSLSPAGPRRLVAQGVELTPPEVPLVPRLGRAPSSSGRRAGRAPPETYPPGRVGPPRSEEPRRPVHPARRARLRRFSGRGRDAAGRTVDRMMMREPHRRQRRAVRDFGVKAVHQ